VSRRHLTMLVALAAIWGAAFMFIEIGLRGLDPGALILVRIGSATVALLLAAAGARRARATLREVRELWFPLAVAGLVGTALPFYLIAWGQQTIDSGTSAILNASAPIWTALLAAAVVRSQRVTGVRLLGLLLGFAGVAVLVGGGREAGHGDLGGSLAVVAAAALYAVAALYVGRRFAGRSAFVVSVGTLAWATVFSLPLGAGGVVGAGVEWEAWGAALALGVVATAVAYLLYYALIEGAGASRAILVTYLVPGTAVLWGVALLGEPLTAAKVGGLALVLGGVALGTGAVRPRRAARLRA
jgi:drug/metabolite transporter (DMT)-like permease